MMKRLLPAFACISLVYLLYIPHALPVLDDWMYLQLFHQARASGVAGTLKFVLLLIDNAWLAQFRIFWSSLMPVFAFSFVADFAGWAYFLLAWTAHLLTAYLLARIAAMLSGDEEIGFIAGAVYAVFPATNNALFWPVSNCIYYFQSLALLGWFYFTWKKISAGDYRYRWSDLALLVPVVFSGEQILPALALLLPIAYWLVGDRKTRPAFLRFWFTHVAAMASLLAVYAVAINRTPIFQGFRNRYENPHAWSLRPASYLLFGSLGVNHDFFYPPDRWWADWTLLGLLALAAIAFCWGLRGSRPRPKGAVKKCRFLAKTPSTPRKAPLLSLRSLRLGVKFSIGADSFTAPKGAAPQKAAELLLWSIAGVILTYLPTARLSTFEWRYLYVPSMFLVASGSALLGLAPRPIRTSAGFLTVAWCLAQTFFGMRQCWIPQSREASGIVNALATAGPFERYDAVIVSGDHLVNGLAPSFITSASWAMQSMLEHVTGLDHIQGARDLVINERGEMALYRRDSFRWFHRDELRRLRIFARTPDNRYVSKSVLALPVSDSRFELLALRPAASRSFPDHPLTMDELKQLPFFGEIYFARQIHSHMKPTDL